MNKNFMENENKGFSLVELIVVIAIMAVLTSVLAPALLQYVEKSRAQKDDSAMGEVTNAVKIALADQDVYDECLAYNVKTDAKAFTDSSENGVPSGYVEGADETRWGTAAAQRGMTITFWANCGSNDTTFVLADARINQVVLNRTNGVPAADSTKQKLGTMDSAKEADATKQKHVLYNKLKAAVGESVKISSQTYRNSEYTVFIKMGTLNGADTGITVKGGWNGTNLAPSNYTTAPSTPSTPSDGEGGSTT